MILKKKFTLQHLLNRAYTSLEWCLNSPPKPHAFASLPLQSDIKTSWPTIQDTLNKLGSVKLKVPNILSFIDKESYINGKLVGWYTNPFFDDINQISSENMYLSSHLPLSLVCLSTCIPIILIALGMFMVRFDSSLKTTYSVQSDKLNDRPNADFAYIRQDNAHVLVYNRTRNLTYNEFHSLFRWNSGDVRMVTIDGIHYNCRRFMNSRLTELNGTAINVTVVNYRYGLMSQRFRPTTNGMPIRTVSSNNRTSSISIEKAQ